MWALCWGKGGAAFALALAWVFMGQVIITLHFRNMLLHFLLFKVREKEDCEAVGCGGGKVCVVRGHGILWEGREGLGKVSRKGGREGMWSVIDGSAEPSVADSVCLSSLLFNGLRLWAVERGMKWRTRTVDSLHRIANTVHICLLALFHFWCIFRSRIIAFLATLLSCGLLVETCLKT